MPEQVIIEFVADTSKLEEAYEKVNSQITATGSLNRDSVAAFQKANTDAAATFGPVTDAAKQLSDQLRNITAIVAGGALKSIVSDLNTIAKAQTDGAESTKTMSNQLAEAKKKLTDLAEVGKKNTQEFANQRKEVERLTIAHTDLHRAVKKVSDESESLGSFSGFSKMFGSGLETAASAAKSLGVENKQLEKSIAQLQNAMKILNGLYETNKQLQDNSPLMNGLLATKTAAYKLALEGVTAIEKTFGVESQTAWAIATGGVSLLVTGIGYVIAKYESLESSEEKEIKRQQHLKELYNDSMNYFKGRNDIVQKNTELILAKIDREMVLAKEKGATEYQLAQLENKRLTAQLEGANQLYLANQKLVDGLRNKEQRESSIENIQRKQTELARVLTMSAEEYYRTYNETTLKAGNFSNDEDGNRKKRASALEEEIKKQKELLELGMAVMKQQDDAYIAYHNHQIQKNSQLKQQGPLKVNSMDIDPKAMDDAVAKLIASSNLNVDIGTKLMRAMGFDSERIAQILTVGVKRAKQDAESLADISLQPVGITHLEQKDDSPTKLSTTDIDAQIKSEQDAAQQKIKLNEDTEKQIATASIQFAKQASDQIFAVVNQNRNQRYNDEISTLQKQKDFELNNSHLTQAQKLAIQRKFDKETAAIKLQQWKADQKSKEEQAIINGALAVTNILATTPAFDFGIAQYIAIAAAAASTATSVATIAAQKPPQFATGTPTGTPDTPAGMKLVGEHGPELIYTPGGERIITAPDTAAILAKYEVPALPNVSADIMMRANAQYAAPVINEKSLAKEIAGEISKTTKPLLQFDKNGFTAHLVGKGGKTTILNNKYKL